MFIFSKFIFRDFKITYDVDYGNCYTFNYQKENVFYEANTISWKHGLRMIIGANRSENLITREEAGIKIVVHDQEYSAFPNVEGYKTSVGRTAKFLVTYVIKIKV